MKNHINKLCTNRLFLIVVLLFTTYQLSYGTTVLVGGLSGPTNVTPNSQHTYTYDSGLLVWPRSWVITGGTLVSSTATTNEEGDPIYQAVVQWGSAGTGTVIFKKGFQTLGTLTVTIAATPPSTYTPSNENYVHTVTPRIASTDVTTLAADEKIETVSYYDGLGRAVQNVGIHAGGNSEDLVTHIEYDLVGRQAKDFLPYADAVSANTATYRTSAASETTTFYGQKYAGTTNPYSEKHFEDSPLNRVEEQGAPGTSWKVNNSASTDHTIKFEYQTNKHNNVANQKIRLYTVSLTSDYTPTLVSNSNDYYNNYELTKTVTQDENWKSSDGYNKTIEEYTDKLGRVILKRTYNANVPHDTYYVYDKYNNLTYVLPPLAEPTTAKPDATELAELCYQYKYDKRNRLVRKKTAGKDWEYIVYDNLDRPVLTQDANQRAKSPDEWLFTKYDVFSRVIYTGIYSSNSSQTSLQNIFNVKSTPQNYEVKTANSGYAGTYYTNSDFPTSSIEILTVNYYDNYTFNRAGAGTSVTTAYGVSSTSSIKGLTTGSRVKVLGTSNWITTVSYYDDLLKPIYVYTKNDYLNTTDLIENKLDFLGNVLETKTTHKKTGKANIVTIDKFDYDHMDRVTKQTQKINLQAEELIAENTYDDLGRLEKKGVGYLASNTTNRLQTVDYKYNIRGWLTEINNVNSLGTDLFSMNIRYNNNLNNSLFNGNISAIEWKTASSDNSLKTYTYTYDAMNRITSGIDNTGNYNVWAILYDKNGNLQRLYRKGHTNTAATTFGNMDLLTYYYTSKSNKLHRVRDIGMDNYGFKEVTDVNNEYTYDANGNMKKDLNKSITNINYNHLNLPTLVTINGQNISYVYDAIGVKIRKTIGSTTTDYAGNHVYENGNLQFFNHAEGYVTPSSGSSFKYIYQFKDHLGNVRLSYGDNNNNGSISQSEIIEENNYYPFGLKHKGYNDVTQPTGNSVANRWGYNGKELQDEDINGKSLDWYDFHARNYDPALGRWMNLDPLAEEFLEYSPYNAMMNNPLRFIDPDGQFSTDVIANEDGTHTVVGGDPNDGDNNIYVVTGNKKDGFTRTGESIGESLTSHSFFDDNQEAVVGAVINKNSAEGQNFIDNEIIKDGPNTFSYMANATGGEHYDFKDRGLAEALAEGKGEVQHNYRGSTASNGKIGSARDFGNIGAGIVAGRTGWSWGLARMGFDVLESHQKGTLSIVPIGSMFTISAPTIEPVTTQKAQKLGFGIGASLRKKDLQIPITFGF